MCLSLEPLEKQFRFTGFGDKLSFALKDLDAVVLDFVEE